MTTLTRRGFSAALAATALTLGLGAAWAIDYPAPRPLADGSQADIAKIAKPDAVRIAYMPPATEFNYYMAIGEGIKAAAEQAGVETFMLAPQSGADINGQMGMIQDAITQNVSGIILSTHDEAAAAPLVKQAVEMGVAVVVVNSDIASFPTPVHGVVGYSQRAGTQKLGEHFLSSLGEGGSAKVGIIEGLPGYHSTERVGGFMDAIKDKGNVEVKASIAGGWNVEGGNTAAMDLLQANPDVDTLFAANDYMIMGAALAAKALGRDVKLLGNDGDTAGLEQIADGTLTATVNTTPFVMGQMAFQVAMDALGGKFPGGFVETPTTIVDSANVTGFLKEADKLYPKPSKAY